jgi:hypothetical protein
MVTTIGHPLRAGPDIRARRSDPTLIARNARQPARNAADCRQFR